MKWQWLLGLFSVLPSLVFACAGYGLDTLPGLADSKVFIRGAPPSLRNTKWRRWCTLTKKVGRVKNLRVSLANFDHRTVWTVLMWWSYWLLLDICSIAEVPRGTTGASASEEQEGTKSLLQHPALAPQKTRHSSTERDQQKYEGKGQKRRSSQSKAAESRKKSKNVHK